MKLTKRSENWIAKLNSTLLRIEVRRLLEGQSVEVGYRATCGSTDRTRKEYDMFMKLIKSLNSQGVKVSQDRVRHGNAYATNNGGFWNSYIFQIREQPNAKTNKRKLRWP